MRQFTIIGAQFFLTITMLISLARTATPKTLANLRPSSLHSSLCPVSVLVLLYNNFNDSDYDQKQLLYPKRAPSTDSALITRARQNPNQVRASVPVARTCTKAPTGKVSMAALESKRTDQPQLPKGAFILSNLFAGSSPSSSP